MKRDLPTLPMALVAGALATIFSITSQAANSPVFHSPSTGNNYLVYDQLKTASDAKAFCLAKQGHLAVLNNHTEAVEVMGFLALVTPSGAVAGDVDVYYTLGAYLPANQTQAKTVTNQAYYTDPNYLYNGFDGSATGTDRYLQVSSYYADFKWEDLSTITRRFVCEFEDAPL